MLLAYNYTWAQSVRSCLSSAYVTHTSGLQLDAAHCAGPYKDGIDREARLELIKHIVKQHPDPVVTEVRLLWW